MREAAQPAWLEALAMFLEFAQVIILAWIAGEQRASSIERDRRRRKERLTQ